MDKNLWVRMPKYSSKDDVQSTLAEEKLDQSDLKHALNSNDPYVKERYLWELPTKAMR
jgi:hypothetical protein